MFTHRLFSLRRAGLAVGRTFQALCFVQLFIDHVGAVKLSFGPSMMPTFSAGNNLILEECISPRLNPPRLERGDIITFLKPTEHSVSVCKRILGLPGDTVCYDPAGLHPSMHIIVPQGHVWVQGDNSSHSLDSRAYGPIPMGLIRGKIFVELYPRPRFISNGTTYIA
ncbi:hypothetical protein FRB93_011455 [Tulasnella sp. JGI-2019a]|nr:hypothetical protein FRB93_011455 [Tulasnella sp. JGI-2019a]